MSSKGRAVEPTKVSAEQSQWYRKRTWAEVDFDALAHNIKEIRGSLHQGTLLMAMVKADAYGHGDRAIVPELERLGVDWLGVGELEEAVELRKLGIEIPILICAPVLPRYAAYLGKYDLTITVPSLEYGQALNDQAVLAGVQIAVHVKLDTGMSRIGFRVSDRHWTESLGEIRQIYALPGLKVTGTYTHFASADEAAPDKVAFKEGQFAQFLRALERLEGEGFPLGIRHCSNSGATLNDESYQMDLVRTGILMYGYPPGDRGAENLDLRPVMSLYTRIHHLKTLDEGCKVSYGINYTADRDRLVGTLGIGYADGYPRVLSNKGYLLYKGVKAPILGNICMDQMVVDLSAVSSPETVAREDVVTVVGTDGNETVTWGMLGQGAGTINYEMICGLGRRVPRIYRRGGVDVDVLSYHNASHGYL